MSDKPKRKRIQRNLTLDPELVNKLREVGASSPSGDMNLSRLVDDAIAEYVAGRWKPDMRKSRRK